MRADVTTQTLYVTLDTHIIHRALNALVKVKVNSMLLIQNLHCIYNYSVFLLVMYLVSLLLLKYADDLIIITFYSQLFSIIPTRIIPE